MDLTTQERIVLSDVYGNDVPDRVVSILRYIKHYNKSLGHPTALGPTEVLLVAAVHDVLGGEVPVEPLPPEVLPETAPRRRGRPPKVR